MFVTSQHLFLRVFRWVICWFTLLFFLPEIKGLKLSSFLSVEAISWIKQHLDGIISNEQAIHLCQVSGFNLWLCALGIYLFIVIHLSSPEPVLSGVIGYMERLQAWKLQYPLGTLIYASLPRSRFCLVTRRTSQRFVAWRDRLRSINFLSGFSLHVKPIRVCSKDRLLTSSIDNMTSFLNTFTA